MIVTAEQAADAAWNARVLASPAGSIFQTAEWASYWAAYLRAKPYFLSVRDEGKVVGQLLVLEMLRGNETLAGGGWTRLSRLAERFLRIFTWREGPIVVDDARRPDALDACLHKVHELAGDRGVAAIDEASLPLAGDVTDADVAVFAQHGFRSEARATVRIDLQPPISALWANLKRDVARTRVRKGQKQGVTLRQVQDRQGLTAFHRLVSEWRREEGFPPYPIERYSVMLAHLGPSCAIFLAEHKGRTVAAAGVYQFNGQAQIFTPVYSHYARQHRIYAGDLVYWELIRWCREHGLTVLDLAGVAPAPTSAKEMGIRRFKEKWGGRIVAYPVFTRMVKPARWKVVSVIREARRRIRSIAR
jgi:lipid II:glycine glycyltransferase (peptidoglycan interpeptide bridge formation enzyme)